MGNPFRRIESPASTALQVIEAHRLFHLVTVIVHGKAMHCRSNCQAMLFYAYCAIISQLYVILCLLSYSAHFGLLCLLCHNKPVLCHAMPTRVPCYAYNVILKLQHLQWHTMLTNTMPIFSITSLLCRINFQAKNRRFLCFLCLSSRSRRLGSSKSGTHDAFIKFYVESKF